MVKGKNLFIIIDPKYASYSFNISYCDSISISYVSVPLTATYYYRTLEIPLTANENVWFKID